MTPSIFDVYPAHIPEVIDLAPIGPHGTPMRPGEALLHEVARVSGFSAKILRGDGRYPAIVRARQWAMYRLALELEMSASAVARIIKRDNSTVYYGIRAHAATHNLPLPIWIASGVPRKKKRKVYVGSRQSNSSEQGASA